MNCNSFLKIVLITTTSYGLSLADAQISYSNTPQVTPTVDNKAKPIRVPDNNDRGQLLYENHCIACHESIVHIREGSKIRSIVDIRQSVQRWASNLNLDWEQGDVDIVTDYLNRRFYHFNKHPQ